MIALAFFASCTTFQAEPAGAQTIERLPGTYRFTEGPVWADEGYLLFTDIPANRIYKWDGKEATVFRESSQGANGLAIGKDGTLYACEHGGRCVSATPKGGQRSVLVGDHEGKRLNSPNDIAIQRSTGAMVFTDPTYGLGRAESETGGKGVYLYDPVKKSTTRLLLATSQPNGVAFSPDEKWLYIADSGSGRLAKYAFRAGGLGSPEWSVEAPSADGIRVAGDGKVWAACSDGVRVYQPNSQLMRTVAFPEQPSNLAFDTGEKNLFVTARTGVYRLRL